MLYIIYIIISLWLLITHKVNIIDKINSCKYVETDLCKIMDDAGSDKGSKHHNYTRVYYDIFKDIRNDKINIFELGIGSKNPEMNSSMSDYEYSKPGASLYGWREFFKNAEIYGADIDKDVLFSYDRIKTYYTDQTNMVKIKDMWTKIGDDIVFDIIIDDGWHNPDANYTFLVNSHHKLRNGGIYVIEDVYTVNEHKITEYENLFKYVKVVDIPGKEGRLIVLQK